MKTEPILIEDALSIILEYATPTVVEELPLLETLGCVLAQDLTTDIDLPPFNSSAMDGFACRKSDLEAASESEPIVLDVVGHIGAGQCFDGVIEAGQAIRIMTGCAVPDSTDCVVMLEDVSWKGKGSVGDKVHFTRAPRKTNINPRGQEAFADSVVMAQGEHIDAAGIGLLASAGHARVPVYARPLLGVISTGSELVGIEDTPAPGQIRDSNSYALAAAAEAAGARVQRFPTSADDTESLRHTILQACQSCDIVVTSGGVSVGDFDLIPGIADELGEVFFTRVNMKPGKSQVFARIADASFFGLAGNPTAASVGFERLVRPLIRAQRGFVELDRPVVQARLTEALSKRGDRKAFLRGVITQGEGFLPSVSPLRNQSSSLIGTLHQCNCLIMMDEGAIEKNEGEAVNCLRLDIDEGTVLS